MINSSIPQPDITGHSSGLMSTNKLHAWLWMSSPSVHRPKISYDSVDCTAKSHMRAVHLFQFTS